MAGECVAWNETPLDDLTEGNSPITYGVVKPGEEGEVPFIRGGDIAGGRILTDQLRTISRPVSEQYRRTLLNGGELLVSLVGNPGQVAIAPPSLAGANIARQVGLVRLRADVDTLFVSYFLRSPVGQQALGAQSLGSVQQVINLRDLKRVVVPLPPLPEQKRIAHILGTLDDKIELNRRMNATLEGISRAIFKSWFVDFDPVRQKAAGKQPVGMDAQTAALFPDSFEDSEIGEVPKGWEIAEVRDFLSLSRESVDPSEHPTETFDHYSIPAFDSGCWPSPDVGADIKSQKLLVAPGSVLISKLNPRTPRVWIPQAGHTRSPVASTEFLVAVPNETTGAGVPFVFCFASSESVVEYLASHASGTSNSHQRVRPDDFLSLRTTLAPNAVLGAFDKVVGPLLQRSNHARRESRTLAAVNAG